MRKGICDPMAFHEIRFPTGVSYAATGGPERRTEIVTLASGYEERNSPWSQSRRRYNAGYGVRTLDDLYSVISFFEARSGQLHGFRWKDWADFRSGPPLAAISNVDQALGTGDGATTDFQLKKIYQSGSQNAERTITKPVAGSLLLAVGGLPQALGTDFTVDITTGLVTLAVAPSMGAEVTAGFEFDVPVRFDRDLLEINLSHFNAGEIPSIPVIELRV